MKFINLNLSYSAWNKTSLPITLVRITLSLIIYFTFGALYYMYDTKVSIDRIYEVLLVKYICSTFIPSFILFGFGRLLFYKMKLVNERAIGMMFEMNDEEDLDVTKGSKHGSNSLEFMEIEMSSKI
jgi:hypothetical protein